MIFIFNYSENPKAQKLFSIAWDFGHANGFSEVYSYATQLVDLVK